LCQVLLLLEIDQRVCVFNARRNDAIVPIKDGILVGAFITPAGVGCVKPLLQWKYFATLSGGNMVKRSPNGAAGVRHA